MKKLRWQILIAVVAMVIIGALLYSEQPASPEEVVEVIPVSGGVYQEALIGSFGRLNPLLDGHNTADQDINSLIYSGLIYFDGLGFPQGDLAESWGISADGKIYNISIRPGAVWHDAEPVTSRDIEFTVDLLRDNTSPTPDDLKEFWSHIEVHILDEKTLQFILPEPFAPFLDYLSFGVLPAHLLEGFSPAELIDSPFNLAPVGSGPFYFDHLVTENGAIKGVVLSAFDDFYAGRPFIDQVVFTYVPDAKSAMAAYEAGEVLGISQVTEEILPQALRNPDLNLYTSRLPQMTLIFFNLGDPQKPFFQDADIRLALLMGLDRQRIVDRELNGQALIADGPIFPGTWAYYENTPRVQYDPEGSIRLLKDAGYTIPASDGNVRVNEEIPLSFELVYPDTDLHRNLAELIKENWSMLGVEVVLREVPYADLLSDYLEPRTFEAALVDINLSGSPDPDPYPFWDQAQATGGQNYSQWNDRQASEFLERARISADITERMKAYRNFQVRFAGELPALPLYFPVYSYGVDNKVQGVSVGPLFTPSDRLITITRWFFIESPVVTEEVTTPTP